MTEDVKSLPAGGAAEDDNLIGGGKVMSVFDHLAELRTRVVRSLVAIFVLFCAALAGAEYLLEFFKQPLVHALPKDANTLHFTGPLDVFLINIKVSAFVAIIFACPVWLYQFWKFFEPALYPKERRYILPFIVVSVALFFLGVSFCYFVILPLTLEYLIGMGTEVAVPLITIKDYISLLLLLVLGFGIVFEFPVLIVLMALLDLVTVDQLKTYRRYIIVVIFILAAILTPSPDPLSMTALAIPVYLMYEGSILLIRFIKGKDAKPVA